jgi:hypothetical protein
MFLPEKKRDFGHFLTYKGRSKFNLHVHPVWRKHVLGTTTQYNGGDITTSLSMKIKKYTSLHNMDCSTKPFQGFKDELWYTRICSPLEPPQRSCDLINLASPRIHIHRNNRMPRIYISFYFTGTSSRLHRLSNILLSISRTTTFFCPYNPVLQIVLDPIDRYGHCPWWGHSVPNRARCDRCYGAFGKLKRTTNRSKSNIPCPPSFVTPSFDPCFSSQLYSLLLGRNESMW